MSNKNSIKLFKNREIRVVWDEDKEEWFFSVIDVVGVLSKSKNPNRYWSDLKIKLKKEGGSQSYENIVQLKMPSSDGKSYKTDVADTEQLLRIIQSIPSPNAEPFKLWLAKIGKERLDEIADPQIAIERAVSNYRKKGYSEEWITQRLKTIEFRKELTAEWNRAGVEEGLEYAILTDEITKAWSGMTTKEYKQFKSIKKENLRDNMSDVELVLNMLAEVSTTQISKSTNPEGFEESKKVSKKGGNVANVARKELEKESGESALTTNNAKNPKLLDKKENNVLLL
jgi:prophage antirepressor-like protein